MSYLPVVACAFRPRQQQPAALPPLAPLPRCILTGARRDTDRVYEVERVCLQLFYPSQGVPKGGDTKTNKQAVEAALLARWKTLAGVKKAYKDIYK